MKVYIHMLGNAVLFDYCWEKNITNRLVFLGVRAFPQSIVVRYERTPAGPVLHPASLSEYNDCHGDKILIDASSSWSDEVKKYVV